MLFSAGPLEDWKVALSSNSNYQDMDPSKSIEDRILIQTFELR